ncbi:hypothetical protein [Brevundimonas lutea]|uniref:hypothetical protein n=1 Tax=Brevundimonas lutea TaxID=2293980 RepID=UPI000F0387E0|nr:hypothetical protein [Brevundimonas lutea]
MTDRSVRNLALLQSSASTSRVLNLLAVWRRHGSDEAWAANPLFRNPLLNRSLIIKHRLRRDEMDLFASRRQVATKVLLPIDPTDLRLGGRSVFVDQLRFADSMKSTFGSGFTESDLKTLRLLDELPSLDPFLLREQLKRHEIEPDRCYFDLTEADLKRMFQFARDEITPLVTMSMGSAVGVEGHASRLVAKILSNAQGEEMEPLRQTLRLAHNEYAEGVFCWKGFLYYKWSLASVMTDIRRVAEAIATVRPMGPLDQESREYIGRSREVLRRKILRTRETVMGTLKVYDDAYAHLTTNGRPTAFREFLLDAPMLFTRLGDQVGAIQHIVSFWNFRFGEGKPPPSVEELIDVFMDFESSLAERDTDMPAQPQAA